MKISTEIASAAKHIGEEKTLEYLGKAGFDAWDFSLFEICPNSNSTVPNRLVPHPLSTGEALRFARKLKQIGLDNGLVCNQSHAPFPILREDIWPKLELAMECTAEAGGKICVIHPNNAGTAEENAEIYRQLLPIAKGYGIKIATENMWHWDREKDESSFAACATSESFVQHIDIVNDPDFVACLDLGHAEMRGSGSGAVNMILALGDRLQALHIHDNDRWHDSHQIPFSMEMDFISIVSALKKIGYSGYFTLEADKYLNDRTPETVFDGIKTMALQARRLAELFESTVIE
ncbi:MAG: sugar phosphate isomerase/epimerase [Oscillospiraceae bacterium]|nr:sugar phosphate isomerase/epimerase [Oscillospiraceae bacterium]